MSGTKRSIVYSTLFLGCLIAYGCLAFSLPRKVVGNVPLLRDGADLALYLKRTGWALTDKVPYRDDFQEYPPVGAYYLGLIRSIAGTDNSRDYEIAQFLVNGLLLFALFLLFLQQKIGLPFYLLLPSLLFYSLNRYDILPSLLTFISILLFINRKETLSALVLVLAIGAKGYALVLIVPLLVLAKDQMRFLSIISLGSVVVLFHPVLYSNLEAVMGSYAFHAERVMNSESFFYLFYRYVLVGRAGHFLLKLSVFLQFVPMPLILGYVLWKKKPAMTSELVSLVCILATGCFIFFSKFHSPQWLLWLVPFILLSGVRSLLVIYPLMDILNYLAVPVFYNQYGWVSGQLELAVLGRTLVMIVLLYGAGKRLYGVIWSSEGVGVGAVCQE